MPNQRAKNKHYVGGYVPRELLAEVKRQARAAGMQKNVFGFAMVLLQEELARRRRRPS